MYAEYVSLVDALRHRRGEFSPFYSAIASRNNFMRNDDDDDDEGGGGGDNGYYHGDHHDIRYGQQSLSSSPFFSLLLLHPPNGNVVRTRGGGLNWGGGGGGVGLGDGDQQVLDLLLSLGKSSLQLARTPSLVPSSYHCKIVLCDKVCPDGGTSGHAMRQCC